MIIVVRIKMNMTTRDKYAMISTGNYFGNQNL